MYDNDGYDARLIAALARMHGTTLVLPPDEFLGACESLRNAGAEMRPWMSEGKPCIQAHTPLGILTLACEEE